jgi:Zn-finger nucleic acid-binding protein
MNCPRCHTPLTTERLRGINETLDTDVCSNCSGRWFDNGELSKVDKIVEPLFIEIRRIPGKTEQLKTLVCPSCNNGQILAKAENARDTKVIMDYCPVCKGIWLDKGELEAIQEENWFITLKRFYRWLHSGE